MISLSVASGTSFGRITRLCTVGVTARSGNIRCSLAVSDERTYSDVKEFKILGDSLIQGDTAWGKLRDKSVTHAKAKGNLFFSSSSPLKRGTDGRLGLYDDGVLLANIDTIGDPTAANACTKSVPGFDGYREENYQYYYVHETGDTSVSLSFDGSGLIKTTIIRPSVEFWSSDAPDAKLLRFQAAYYQISYSLVEKVNGLWYVRAYSSQYTNRDMTASEWASFYQQNLNKTCASWTSYDSAGSISDPNALKTMIEDVLNLRIMTTCGVETHPVDFGELSVQAAMGCSYVDQNVLLLLQDVAMARGNSEYMAKLVNFDEFKVLKRTFAAYSRGETSLRLLRVALKRFSSVFLTWHYAIAPNTADVERIGKGLNEALFGEKYKRVHARKGCNILNGTVNVSYMSTLTAQIQSVSQRDWGMLRELIYLGKRWGGYPETQNLWDILPFSFIVDWFVQYGDFFKSIDDYLRIENYFPVDYAVLSEKWECTVSGHELFGDSFEASISGEVELSYYSRWIIGGGDMPTPKVALTASTTLSNHWVETGCLVAQRL